MKDTKLNLRISEEMKSKLDIIAQEEDKTVSDIIRGMINVGIDGFMDIDFDKKMLDQKIEKVKVMLDSLDDNLEKNIVVFDSAQEQSLCIKFDSYQLSKTTIKKHSDNVEREYIKLILLKSDMVVGKCTINVYSNIQAWKSFNALEITY